MGCSLRVNRKKLSTDFSPDRNDPFLYLSDLRQRLQRRGLPIISVIPRNVNWWATSRILVRAGIHRPA
jgi:hypothetical protein